MGTHAPEGRARDFWMLMCHEASESAVLLSKGPEVLDEYGDGEVYADFERAALRYVAGLTVHCVSVANPLMEESPLLVPLRQEVAPAKLRWEIESGIHTVPRIGPWSREDIDVLRQFPPPWPVEERAAWFDAMGPQFESDWHDYMTVRGFGRNREAGARPEGNDYGRVTLLAMTVERLAHGVRGMLAQYGLY